MKEIQFVFDGGLGDQQVDGAAHGDAGTPAQKEETGCGLERRTPDIPPFAGVFRSVSPELKRAQSAFSPVFIAYREPVCPEEPAPLHPLGE